MNIFDSINKGLDESIQYQKGNKKKANKRKIEICDLPKYEAYEIKEIRLEREFSQAIFARVLGVSVKTVEAWESGRNNPSGPALRLLNLLHEDKNILERNNIVKVS